MNREKRIRNVTLAGSVINFFLILFKFFAGVFGNSSALIADAVHSLSDFASDLIVLFCIRLSGRPEDADHAYGHGKFETLASVVIGLILLGTGLGLLWESGVTLARLSEGEAGPAPGWLAFAAALISIAVKEGLYRYTMAAALETDSSTLKANAWHHRSDAISSIATVVGTGGAMLPGKGWLALDPIAAGVISLFIIAMSFSLMKPGLDELMEKSLPENEMAAIGKILDDTPELDGYHRLRTRRVGANRAIEVHIKLDGGMSLADAHEIATLIEKRLKAKFGENTHVGIHMEPSRKSPGRKPA